MKLNIGCGGDIREGFINIDFYARTCGTMVIDVSKGFPFPPGSVEYIVAQDVLEHFSHRDTERILKSWIDTLQPGGEIEIRSPDARKQAELFISNEWNCDIFAYMVYGGQEQPGNFHKTCFTLPVLRGLVEKLGLTVTEARHLHGGITNNKATSSNPNLYVKARRDVAT